VVMTKLRRLFNRARPESQELNILRGILASIDKSVKSASVSQSDSTEAPVNENTSKEEQE